MKKKNLNNFKLNKKTISNFNSEDVQGGKPSLSNYNLICGMFSVGPHCQTGTLSVNNDHCDLH